MKNVERTVLAQIKKSLTPNKVLTLIGPRRVGKTVLLKTWASELKEPYLFWNGEDMALQDALARRTIENYMSLVGKYKLVFIDEAQNIPDIGNVLKLMVDELEDVCFVISGSSAFGLQNRMGEPLTGRQKTFILYPLAESEYALFEDPIVQSERIRERMIYGNYPELLHMQDRKDKESYLNELVQSYLLKDILSLEGIRNSQKILSLLQLIAYQVGSEVSFQELGRQLGISKNTVERYLDLLTKVFVIYRLGGFSRNLRKEISKSSKWYFYDNGIRNILVANMNPLEGRHDVGQLWENYVLAERIKFQSYTGLLSYNYFWRTYDQQELDWIEVRGGELFAYELKWNPNKKISAPVAWRKAYPDAHFQQISPDNLQSWINQPAT